MATPIVWLKLEDLYRTILSQTSAAELIERPSSLASIFYRCSKLSIEDRQLLVALLGEHNRQIDKERFRDPQQFEETVHQILLNDESLLDQ